MQPAAAERVRELFDAAADLPPDERDAFLAEACAGEGALAAEVRDLLAYVGAPTPAVPTATDDAPSAPIPAALGRFELRGKLGEGGMGVVYRAHDRALEREVALKLVNARGGRDARARLVREAQAMARVAHPHVVPIFDVGVEGERVFIAMELIEGPTLAAWLRAAPRPWRETLRLLIEAGRGLAAAHRAGLLHRDVKPDNILVGADGRARVVDFGLARAARPRADDAPAGDAPADDAALDRPPGEDDRDPARAARDSAGLAAELTRAGAILGTPGFMSPEHFDGTVTALADQWSFAATAYHALFGQLPWAGADLRALREAALTTPPRPPVLGAVPPAVADAIRRGLAPLPEDRFASLDAMLDVLAAALVVDPHADRHRFRRQRRQMAWVVLAIGALNLVVAGLRTDFRYDLRVAGVLFQGLVGLAILVAAALGFRRALLGTAHDRRVMALFVIALAAQAAHRALALDGDVVAVLRADAVMVIAMLLFAALTVEAWLVLPAAGMLGQLLLSLAWPAATVPTFPIAQLAVLAFGLWFWREP